MPIQTWHAQEFARTAKVYCCNTWISPYNGKSCYEEFGADFTQHLYVLEVDPMKGVPHNEREEHNHVLKRIATCTSSGNNIDLHYEVFVEAMRV